MTCRLCEAEAAKRFSRLILGKYTCAYFYCSACGLLQTEQPYWLDEAYASAITTADTGLVYRNLLLAKIVSALLFFLFPKDGRYLDFAGGYGMFTRLMRDIGFDFYWTDLYCDNLVARGFEASNTTPPYAAVTAFEVLEHVPSPLDFVAATLDQAKSRTLIFSTELFAGEPPDPDAWWYYTFQTGQHIAFYQRRTLETIGRKLGLQCYSNGMLHILTDRKISPFAYRLLTTPRVTSLLAVIIQRSMKSKMISDHNDILHR